MRSRKLQYLHVNDFTSDFTTIPALGPRLRLLNLGRPPADLRICAAEFQNLFRFERSIAARIAETCIFTFCDNLSSIGQALATGTLKLLPLSSPALAWPGLPCLGPHLALSRPGPSGGQSKQINNSN